MLKNSINLIPARRDLYQAKLVFWLFIASLTVFFVASLITYIVIRTQAFHPIQREYETLKIPNTFWTSTLLLVLISIFLQRACWLVHREKQVGFRRWLIWAMIAAAVFVGIQWVGMRDLIAHHFSQNDGSTKIYGMSFTLALIHALHVLGGMIFLGFVIYQALRDRYDHERHWAVDHCAAYWHFLDIVWVTMLAMFFFTR